jgi:hypothetical protein
MPGFFKWFEIFNSHTWKSNHPPELLAPSKRFRRRKLKKQLKQQRQLPHAPEGMSVIHISVPCDEVKPDVVTWSERIIDAEEEMKWLESMRDWDISNSIAIRDIRSDSEDRQNEENSSQDESIFKKMLKSFRKVPHNNKTRDKRSGSGSSCTSYSSDQSHRDSSENSLGDYTIESNTTNSYCV